MSAIHGISKIEQKSQNRIPRELDQKFGIPRISTIHGANSTFLESKNRSPKKVISISYPFWNPEFNLLIGVHAN